MRNLKKLLALVLAMMMAFSLMVTANAANPVRDYPDKDQADEAFEEAIDVLTGMKVYSGDNGNFKPAANITRAEVAALLYRLATGDVDDSQADLYAEYGNFPDVSHDAWYAGYVGYCANAGYIKGRSNGNFDPSGNVTGYEALAMILRAIGYDKNGEFTGATWQTEVSALSQQLGILTNVKTTQYGGTLHLAARRDVVADLLFQADAFVPMVVYTPAFGYQPYGMANGTSGGNLIGSTQQTNPTLGNRIFGLTYTGTKDDKASDRLGVPVLLGNEQTGQSKGTSVMGYPGNATTNVHGGALPNDANGNSLVSVPYTEYTWAGTYAVDGITVTNGVATGIKQADAGTTTNNAKLGDNKTYTLSTGIDLIGHKLKLWYDDGTGSASLSNKRVYAYFDKSTLHEVVVIKNGVDSSDGSKVAVTNPTEVSATATQGTGTGTVTGGTNLYDEAKAAGFSVSASTKAVFNNSFGKFGSDFDTSAVANAGAVGSGEAVSQINVTGSTTDMTSPVRVYKLISNSPSKSLDAVIALNIESSQITETNDVNRVPTLGVPVNQPSTNPLVGTENQAADWDGTTANMNAIKVGSQFQTAFIDGDLTAVTTATQKDKNLKNVNGTVTGVIAQAALVGNSTKALGDYEFGIHITGTSPRTVSSDENTAINGKGQETAYFLMNQVTAPVQGTVVAYNVNAGTVTLDNGTVLERSKFYHTVVGWDDNETKANTPPTSQIPQSWMYNGTKWVEGYANVGYKFYLDYEGKYLGAERAYGSTFLYGTYLDYDQKVSTSSFNYYLTGVTLDGEIETVQVSKYWDTGAAVTAADTAKDITGTDLLAVPFRDTYGSNPNATSVNGIGEGVYTGFAITGDTVDSYTADSGVNKNEYLNNMARLGVMVGDSNGVDTNTTIDSDSITLGAEVVGSTPGAGTNKYFTEATKFILVSGIGTDSVKAEVYDGISDLKGASSSVILKLGDATTAAGAGLYIPNITAATDIDKMTYFKESPYTYAQSGDTDKKIDVIILPKAAVTWTGGSSLYYVGDPTPSLVNSWGTDAWKYNLYMDGELQQVWLTNDPNSTAAGATYHLDQDTFMNLKDTGKTANDGQPIYTAGNYNAAGTWTAGAYLTNNNTGNLLPDGTKLTYLTGALYSAITRDAQTATFDATAKKLLRVAEAKVVNLNAQANCFTRPASGYIWPGITDLSTLNQAGSIDPVTGRDLKVAAVIDSSNPLVVTCIYVCYDQTVTP